MRNFTNVFDKSLATENWYAALALALVIPDICGRLENPEMGSGERYASVLSLTLATCFQGFHRGRLERGVRG